MDIITSGVDGVFGGAPLWVDVTCVSPICGDGVPMPQNIDRDGIAVPEIENRNRITDYPNIEASTHTEFLFLGVNIV